MRLRKSVWMTTFILIYFITMTAVFAEDWIAAGHTTRLVITIIFELVIIVAMYLFIKKRENL